MSSTVGSPWIVDVPHYEPPGLEGQIEHIQSLNREHARKRMREWIDARRAEFEKKIAYMEKRYAEGCDFCAGLPIGGGYDLKSGAGNTYGLVEDHKADTLACPKCSRIVAAWE